MGILTELFAHVNSSWWSCILLYPATRLTTASLGYALVGYLCYYLRQRRSRGQGVNNKDILGVEVRFNWGLYNTWTLDWTGLDWTVDWTVDSQLLFKAPNPLSEAMRAFNRSLFSQISIITHIKRLMEVSWV